MKRAIGQVQWFWLSFADSERCRGVAIVDGSDFVDAVRHAGCLGISPGGQVVGLEIPPESLDDYPAHLRLRLLTAEEADRIFDAVPIGTDS